MTRLKPHAGIVADSAAGAAALLDAVRALKRPRRDNRKAIAAAKAKAAKAVRKLQPQVDYLDVIRAALPRDGLFVTELCQAGFASYTHFPVYAPRTYVSEGFQGTLGAGFQTALGVKVAHPDKAVVSITGDGGFMFGVQELATAVQHGIGLVTVLFNNESFGNVRRDQETRYQGRVIGADLVNPDFMKLAESFGVKGASRALACRAEARSGARHRGRRALPDRGRRPARQRGLALGVPGVRPRRREPGTGRYGEKDMMRGRGAPCGALRR